MAQEPNASQMSLAEVMVRIQATLANCEALLKEVVQLLEEERDQADDQDM